MPGDLQRYPTTREIVDAALAQGATLTAEPTRIHPNYAVPCEDLDGNPCP
jgi:predicted lactoylglutathione lyase